MRRIVLAALAVALLPAAASAQSNQAMIEKALSPVPQRAQSATMVIQWNKDDYTYDVLQEGTNGMVCFDRSSEPRRAPFDVECTSVGNLDRVAQSLEFHMTSADNDEENAKVAAAEANGTRVLPVYGSLWMHFRGQNRGNANMHTTIAVPGATASSLGLPTQGGASQAFLMNEGTSTAHIMVPGR